MANNKYKVNCSICQKAKNDPKMRNRIRRAAFDREEGDETLRDIAFWYNLSPSAMYNHAKKHIKPVDTESRSMVIAAKKVATIQANVQKEAELQLDRQTVDEIDARPVEIMGLDEYIAQGIDTIQKGELKITPSSFLAAVKIKTDWSSKQQTNKIELMRTIAAFASGAKKGKNGDTTETTESDRGGQDEAGNIYQRAFGHAVARRAIEISEGNVSSEEED